MFYADLQRVFRQLRQAKVDSAIISDLSTSVANVFPGAFAAVSVPVVAYRKQFRAQLLTTDKESNVINDDFAEPMDVVGFMLSIQPFPDQSGNDAPTLKDIEVKIEWNATEKFSTMTQANGGPPYIVAELVDNDRTAALYGVRIRNVTPKVSIQYRWRSAQADVPTLSCDIALIVLFRPIGQDDGRT